MIGKKEYGYGFANAKFVAAFKNNAIRSYYLFSSKDLSAKKITREQAIKMSEKILNTQDRGAEIFNQNGFTGEYYILRRSQS